VLSNLLQASHDMAMSSRGCMKRWSGLHAKAQLLLGASLLHLLQTRVG
jgi:hypothetical protein